ncbi:MAG: hypothetical protein ACR2I5_12730 [Candidatus Limnocylindria bacterium]
MDDGTVRLRIRVIVVSTRAALRSLGLDDPQADEVLERGRTLLAGLERAETVSEDGARDAFVRAREELDALETR